MDTSEFALPNTPSKIDIAFLSQFPEFVKFRTPPETVTSAAPAAQVISPDPVAAIGTPDEVLRDTVRQLSEELRDELLERLLASDPSFFEFAVVKLLEAMEYGGSQENAGKITGKPGDGGLDGVIDGDPLGLDRVYIQAKRYKVENKIGPSDVQAFYGAVSGAKATKGVFVTTSDFTHAASQVAESAHIKLVLINGERLAQLMYNYNVGVRLQETLYVKKLDEDFFAEE